jgi:hypothetical protein
LHGHEVVAVSRIGAETKPAWRTVPASVRARVEQFASAPVARAMRVWGGYAPSPTFRLFLVDGQRIFFKAVNRTSNEYMHRALTAEERVYHELGHWVSPWAPTLVGSFHEADWHVLLLEELGRPSFPPWTLGAVNKTMAAYAEFHHKNLGQQLPEWLSRRSHHGFARRWTALEAESGGLEGMARLAGPRAAEALAWTTAAVARLRTAAEALVAAVPPHTLLHLDTRSDNVRLQPGGRLRIFDWPNACVGPPELDVAAFAQSITCEGGPEPEEALAAYTRQLPVRESVLDAAVAALAGYFAAQAWRDPIPGLPRVRAFQRRQLKSSLTWAADRLNLPSPEWLVAVEDSYG